MCQNACACRSISSPGSARCRSRACTLAKYHACVCVAAKCKFAVTAASSSTCAEQCGARDGECKLLVLPCLAAETHRRGGASAHEHEPEVNDNLRLRRAADLQQNAACRRTVAPTYQVVRARDVLKPVAARDAVRARASGRRSGAQAAQDAVASKLVHAAEHKDSAAKSVQRLQRLCQQPQVARSARGGAAARHARLARKLRRWQP